MSGAARGFVESIESRVLLSVVVTSLADDGSAGTLRTAIAQADAASTPTTITFAAGLNGTITLAQGSLDLTNRSAITIQGPGSGLITVNGNNATLLFMMNAGVAEIDGMTMTGGSSGAIDDAIGTLTISNCNVVKNGGRGAIMTSPGRLTISRSTISDNSGDGISCSGMIVATDCDISKNAGTGISAMASGDVALNNCTVSQNCGGIYTNAGGTITNCRFEDNLGLGIGVEGDTLISNCTVVRNGGAGIVGQQTHFTVADSTISGNHDRGIVSFQAPATILNSTIAGNTSSNPGGGISFPYGYYGNSVVTNCTISNNTGLTGGGVYLSDGFPLGVIPVTLNNTIVASNHNQAGAADDIATAPPAGNVKGSNNLIGPGGPGGLMNGVNGNIVGVADPGLAPLANYGGPTQTMALIVGSPAIDHGSNTLAAAAGLTIDQRGQSRVYNGTVDIGAFEAQIQSDTPYIVTSLADDGSAGTLRYEINVANQASGPANLQFAPGLHGTVTLTHGELDLTNVCGEVIQGPGANVIAINGNHASTIFAVAAAGSSATIQITGLTIAGAAGQGGIMNSSGTLVVAHCTLAGNAVSSGAITNLNISNTVAVVGCTITANQGDGIFNTGTLTVSNGTISGNTGFGIDSRQGGTLTVTNTIISANHDGIYNDLAVYGSIDQCIIVDNTADGIFTGDPITIENSTIAGNGGAGIRGYQTGFTVLGSTIAQNRGGGIAGSTGAATIANCTITGNTTAGSGGGIYLGSYSDNTLITNCTIASNTAAHGGGGIFLDTPLLNGAVIVNNTIVASNHNGTGAADDIRSSGSNQANGSNNLIGAGGSGAMVNGANGNIVGAIDPGLAPLGDYGGPTQTMALLRGSPALDHGSNALASAAGLTTDQRGLARVFNTTVDIGAYEAQPPAQAGDVNHDGKVDFTDLLTVARNYGKPAPLWENGDTNGDGMVNFADLLAVAQNYGRPAQSAAAAATQSLVMPQVASAAIITTSTKRHRAVVGHRKYLKVERTPARHTRKPPGQSLPGRRES